MDEQVTWKPHLKLLEMLLMILSWPGFLQPAPMPSACKIQLPNRFGSEAALLCRYPAAEGRRKERAPTEPF